MGPSKVAVVLCLAALISVAPVLAHADQLVTNGSFTSGSTGWTFNPSSSFPWTFTGGSASTGCVGPQCIVGPMSGQAYLYQDLTTVAGDTYTLSFQYSPANGTPTELLVLFGGTTATDLVNIANTSLALYTITGLTATSSDTRLEFLGRQDPSFNELTSVSVSTTGTGPTPTVPEPGTLALVGGGIISLAGAAKRKFRS
jgi:hypothetical protein